MRGKAFVGSGGLKKDLDRKPVLPVFYPHCIREQGISVEVLLPDASVAEEVLGES